MIFVVSSLVIALGFLGIKDQQLASQKLDLVELDLASQDLERANKVLMDHLTEMQDEFNLSIGSLDKKIETLEIDLRKAIVAIARAEEHFNDLTQELKEKEDTTQAIESNKTHDIN